MSLTRRKKDTKAKMSLIKAMVPVACLIVCSCVIVSGKARHRMKNRLGRSMPNRQIVTFDWGCARTQSFPRRALSRIAHEMIPPDDRGRLGVWADRAFVMRLRKDRGAIYFVPLVCGATGNCSWGLFTLNPPRSIGEVDGEYFYTYQSPTGWPTIVSYTHMSAAEGVLGTFVIRRGKYKWIGDEYPVSSMKWAPKPMPGFLERARRMCKAYGEN
jgi:hypothetical protein